MSTVAPDPAPSTSAAPPPPDWLRHAVRGVLEQSPGYHSMASEQRRSLAQAMVRVSTLAAALIAEESAADGALKSGHAQAQRQPLARAQEAPPFGTSADRIAGITKNVLGAVSFPRFVTDLINGVFKSMLDSNAQQMQMYVQLLNNVSASAEGFERSQFSTGSVRQWVADHFPEQIEYDVPVVEPGDDPPDPEELANIKLRLRPGANMPGEEELRSVLGLQPNESTDAGNPEQLVPLARRQIARQRQQMLATMVMMGMQRIVIDSGRINASMRFHIDTRSAASDDRGSQFGLTNRVKASGSFGAGPWGASAEVENTISYVSTERSQHNEEINTDVNLDSSVELVFKTDYLPLERMAGGPQIERIKVNTLNPDAETKAVTDARTARDKANRAAEGARSDAIGKAIAPPPPPPPPPPAVLAKTEAKKEEPKKEDAKKTEVKKEEPKKDETKKTAANRTPAQAVALQAPDVVYVPTAPQALDTMLEIAEPRRGEVIVEPGCGDARILIAAASRFGCRGIGWDVDPERIEEAQAAISAAGVGALVRVEQRDLFTAELGGADIVALYLLPRLNARLLPQLLRLKPGARVVSNDFEIPGISPDRVVQEYLPESGLYKTCFLYRAPLRQADTPPQRRWVESTRLPWEQAAGAAVA